MVPFFADIAATVVEDGLRDNTSEELEISEDPTPYPSNNDLTDHIIHSVMRREEVRHGLDLSVNEVVQLLSGLVADYSKRWPRYEMLDRLTLLYDSRGPGLNAKISLNPLLTQTSESFELRYGFLASYFDVVHLLQGILSQSLEREFLGSLARLNVESNEFRDLKRFFSARRQELLGAAKALISRLRKELEVTQTSKPIDVEQNRRALSSLLNLAAQVFGGSAQQTTELILRLYDVQEGTLGSQATISGLHLRGDFPPMDFTNLMIVRSRFSGYKNLLASKFQNTRFMYSVFDLCFDASIHSSTLDPQSLDHSCELGDLREFITLARAGKQDEKRLVETEARKFLHSFFRGDRFTDNRKGLIRFSNKVPGLADNKFDRIVSAGYVSLKREKEVATFYEISESFRPSVRRLLTDNYTDSSMRKFFAFLKG